MYTLFEGLINVVFYGSMLFLKLNDNKISKNQQTTTVLQTKEKILKLKLVKFGIRILNLKCSIMLMGSAAIN